MLTEFYAQMAQILRDMQSVENQTSDIRHRMRLFAEYMFDRGMNTDSLPAIPPWAGPEVRRNPFDPVA